MHKYEGPRFRVGFNGLWYRVEYRWGDGWGNAAEANCYSNIPRRFDSFDAAVKVRNYLEHGGMPHEFKEVNA